MEKQFKVGDIITHTQYPESKLKVVFVESGISSVPYECDVLDPGKPADDGDSLSAYVGKKRRRWVSISHAAPYVDPKKPKRPKPDEVITIKRFGDRTEAHYSTLAKTVTIKRYKDDKHDMHKACIYALDKLFDDGMDVTIGSGFYNGIVVCVSACGNSKFKPGQLYRIKEGRIMHPTFGVNSIVVPPYRSFEDLRGRNHFATFMEVHL